MNQTFNPVSTLIADSNHAPWHLGANGKSLVLLGALLLMVAGVFAYFYLREWWFNRCFRRYCALDGAKDNITPAVGAAAIHREPLIKCGRPKGGVSRVPAGEASQSQLTGSGVETAGKQTQQLWVIGNKSESTGGADSSAAASGNSTRGFLNVHAEDAFSEVFVDGLFVGNAPAKLSLTEGLHVVEIKTAGCKNYRREITVAAGAELRLRAALEKQVTPIAGVVKS